MDLSAPAAGLDHRRGADPAGYAIGGRFPRLALRPVSYEEVAEALRAAARDRLAVVPWGGGAGLGRDTPPPRYDLALDLRALDRILEHEPADFTLTAQCGVTVAALGAALAARGQELPLEAPLAARATLGGALAANAVGPRRLRFGAPRDRILGARFALGDGTLARTGGKVVKNVAGYGIHRLLCGSRGGLGVILEASLKLATAPAARLALAWGGDARALADASRWAPFPRLEPAVFTVTGGAHDARLPAGVGSGAAFTVILGFEDEPARVAELEAIAVRALGPPRSRLQGDEVAGLWQALADAETAVPARTAWVTAANTPAALADVAESPAAATAVFHVAGGRLHVASPPPAMAARLRESGFSLVETDAAARAPEPAAPPAAATLGLRARIRAALDPQRVLAYGERWERAAP